MRTLLQRFALMLVLAPGAASAGSIGIYSEPDCSSCNLTIGAGVGFDTLYVRMSTTDMDYGIGWDGLTVAFRIEGLPAGWFLHQLEGPDASFILGNPFDPDGVVLGMSTCCDEGDLLDNIECFPLYTFVLGPATLGAPAQLHVSPPAGPYADPGPWCSYLPECPYFRYYPFELYCECAVPGTLYVNTPGDCFVGIQPTTWSQVKRRYE
jgi:hypothetical protein